MDYAISGSIYTILVFVSFIGVVFWAYSKKSQANFDEAKMLIFDDEPQDQSQQDNQQPQQETKVDE